MAEQVRIAKVTISEDRSDPIITLTDGEVLVASSVSVEWKSNEELPVVTLTSDILHGVK